tara:strand:+ start:789 stop:1052 length:264 start_codon:yes stop_codon:yes gene_type:complete
MLKEVKYLFFILIILIFIFFVGKHYFSDLNKKKSYRSEKNISQKVNLYSKNLPTLENDTLNIIEYSKNTKTKKKKKFSFWELIGKDD